VSHDEVCDGHTACTKHRDDERYCRVLGPFSLSLSTKWHYSKFQMFTLCDDTFAILEDSVVLKGKCQVLAIALLT